MSKKQPRDATPDLHVFQTPADQAPSIAHRYGTYNIQPTCDTGNTFPLIAQGLPKAMQSMRLGKEQPEQ